jgi:hypothetical protein
MKHKKVVTKTEVLKQPQEKIFLFTADRKIIRSDKGDYDENVYWRKTGRCRR